ncbi:MAG: 3-hydroxyacyl-ACP dehydratase FabZ family protein [Planctomycetota bacterium]
MHFALIDRVLELEPERLVAIKQVSASEEYLLDHFPGFPVLPGVMMIEAMVQAARELLGTDDPASARFVLGSVRALKYGSFVAPGDTLRVEVTRHGQPGTTGAIEFKGKGTSVPGDGSPEATAVSGRFVLRPIGAPGTA